MLFQLAAWTDDFPIRVDMLGFPVSHAVVALDPYGRLSSRPVSTALVAILVFERLILVIIGFPVALGASIHIGGTRVLPVRKRVEKPVDERFIRIS